MIGVVSVFELMVVIVPVPVLDLLLYPCSLSVCNLSLFVALSWGQTIAVSLSPIA